MADSTLDSELFILYDNWPGETEGPGFDYGSGLLDARFNNVSIPAVEAGTKMQLYNTGLGKDGFTTLIYLQMGTQDAQTAVAAKAAVVSDSATLWYQVTNDGDNLIKIPSPLGAYALGAVTNAYWAWFWCAGVCPETFVPAMGGDYKTDGAVAAGNFLFHDLTQDEVGIGGCSAVNEPPAGFALAADA